MPELPYQYQLGHPWNEHHISRYVGLDIKAMLCRQAMVRACYLWLCHPPFQAEALSLGQTWSQTVSAQVIAINCIQKIQLMQ